MNFLKLAEDKNRLTEEFKMITTNEYLHQQYGPLMTLGALAETFDRSPDGLRMTLGTRSTFANSLNAAKRKFGRRVYFDVSMVAKIIDGETAGQ